ncbi:hypothetical protein AKJ57_02125 [candidate division MSBL1 archaeon SCGC-AAA259A05]|uniref:Uncharacterized protein n=1 Tax=candidate division MSBL1 archaeon SCGC-AAA259A05 TaxID=1698259 RepID=A0A133UAI4_9EURY|nr:hypothetical protein AKJ57_02125 [candidate division MSBL1 archaeon SCGC-AAA259A05]
MSNFSTSFPSNPVSPNATPIDSPTRTESKGKMLKIVNPKSVWEFMKYEEKLRRAKEFGEIVTEEELLDRLKLAGDHQYFHPYGCLNCGRAHGKQDFEKTRYVIYEEGYDERKASKLFSVGGGSISYASIAKCKFCGHSEIYPEPSSLDR